MDFEELRGWLTARVAAEAGLRPEDVDPDQPFSAHGLDSARLAAVADDLERALGEPVDVTLAFEHPTVATLTAALAERRRSGGSGSGATQGRSGEPVAIVGIACRVPGARDAAAFWGLLRDGTDAVGLVPPGRWGPSSSLNGAASPSATAGGGDRDARVVHGGFLDGVDLFDAGFFRIAADEAASMDPQQRLLLETCWEALEDAGEVPARRRGSRTGVFVGISAGEYGGRQLQDPAAVSAHTATGGALSVAANRVSYLLDLRGPSLAVDTACSSSLVAVHLACRALRAGECDLALAGGVNVLLGPELSLSLARAGMLAPDGRCKAFDARADGYVRGEGCGVLVLKPLRDALHAGDRVYAVVAGGAVNQDGASNGLTAPNPAAQRAVLADAYRDAGIDPARAQYVECHGTGTSLGDRVEAAALGAVVGARRGQDGPCRIGSVKTNIGHLEAAAGVAGLVKVALALHHDRLPPSLHLQRPNPHIDLDRLGLAVVTGLEPWPGRREGRAAGVSSFGFGGTNAHLVLTAAPMLRPAPARTGPAALPVSARSQAGLSRLLAAWADRLDGADPAETAALAYTAAVRRTHHRPFRMAVIADGLEGLAGRAAQAAASPAALARTGTGPPAGTPRVAFAFSGQGARWAGVGAGLLRHDPLFASAVRRCDELLAPELGWSVEAVLRGEDHRPRDGRSGRDLDDTAVAQPVLATVQLALAQTWRALGIEPAAVIGHSAGEVAAAVVAGVLDLETGLRLAALRGRAMAGPGGEGRMLAVGLARDEAARMAADHPGQVDLAAVNGPSAAVLAGDPAALETVRAGLAARGLFARWLDGRYAFHSRRMAAAAEALADALAAGFGPRPGGRASVPFFSSVLGRGLGGGEAGAAYWAAGVRAPVEFAAAAGALLDAEVDGTGRVDAVLELGPHPALRTPLRQLADAAGRRDLFIGHSLERGRDDRRALLDALGRLYELGCPVRWAHLFPEGGQVASVPGHPWERARHWLGPAPGQSRGAGDGRPRVEPDGVELRRVAPTAPTAPAEPSTAELSTAELSTIEPSTAELSTAELSTIEPSMAELSTTDGVTTGRPDQVVDGRRDARSPEPERPAGLWLYEPRWRERPLTAVTGPLVPPAGRWLVLAGPDGPGRALLEGLRQAGVAVVACMPGTGFARPAPDEARIDPWEPAHYQRLIDELSAAPGPPLAGVVHLWTLAPAGEGGLDGPAAALPAVSVLHLVRALAFAPGGALPRLLVATRGCQPAGDGVMAAASPLPATVWGLLKNVPVEHPLLAYCCVDLDPEEEPAGGLADGPGGGPVGALAALMAELAVDGPDTEVAYRRGRRYVRRLAKAGAALGARPVVRADATYVITGGTGGLGRLLAGWLAGKGAGRVALLARRPPRAGADQALDAALWTARAAGAEIEVVEADVRDRGMLDRALDGLRRSGPPVRGVVHAAGVLDDRALLDLTANSLRTVLEPKVLGGWHLNELTAGDPLDWFLLLSSAAGALGSPGQAAYAAANAFLDALAHHRRQAGRPATAIDFGPWAGIGMAAGTRVAGRLQTAVSVIDPIDGLTVLGQLLGGGPPQAVVLPFDLRDLLQFYPAETGASFFEELATEEVRALKSIGVQSSARPDLPTPYVAARGAVERRIAGIWQASLGIEPVGVDDSFFELGGDSVVANQVLVQVNRALEVTIDPEVAFERFTVARLAALAEAELVARLERMTDAEAACLLADQAVPPSGDQRAGP